MKISIASDHAGFEIKNVLIDYLNSEKIQFVDFGTTRKESCDYPDFAFKVAENVRNRVTDLGILICTTGIGMTIAANKVKGIRAALLLNLNAAELAKAHNNANVICFSAKSPKKQILKMFEIFLKTKFEAGRHERRIKKIMDYEKKL